MAATNKRGVFSLETVLERQSDNHWSNIFDPFVYQVTASVQNNFGFYAGYHDGGHSYVSTIYRQNFTDDTVTTASQMTVPRASLAAVSNSNHGYWCGGRNPSASTVSSIDRLDFSNFTAAATPKGNLGNGIWINDSAGNTSYGYIHGQDSGSYTSNIYRIDYANDGNGAPARLNLPDSKYYGSALGNQSYGYWAGGSSPSYAKTSTIHRVDYSNDTATAVAKGTLNNLGSYGNNSTHSGQGNSNYGYVGGGELFSSPVTQVRRIDYANDTAATVDKGNLTSQFSKGASSGNHSNAYFAGGGSVSSIQKVDFANDTATAPAVTSLPGNPYSAFFTGQGGSGPLENGNPETIVYNFPAANGGTTSTLGPAFGYAVGGYASSNPRPRSTVDRIDYSNDTATAVAKGPLNENYFAHQSTSNLTHAYAAAGYPSRTSVSRIEFSNDTATAVAKGPLSSAHNYFGATGNTSFGYYAGGESSPGPDQSTVDRIDYSNDTATAVAKGPLSFAKKHSQACGNMSFGYWAGAGYPDKSSVDRVDYSSDTSTASPKGNLESGRSTMVASGTSDFGYWSGGFPYYTKASRIEYANDTATAVAKVPYPSTVSPYGFSNAAGTGSSTHGYAFGGNGYNTYVWRFEYANDTTNASPKGPLSDGRIRFSGASAQENGMASTNFIPRIRWVDSASETPASPTTAFAYFAGGSPGLTTQIERIDYSNDTATASLKGNLPAYGPSPSPGVEGASGVSSNSFGYIAGGNNYPSGRISHVSRIDYSNDTATAPNVGPLATARNQGTAIGNQSFGYIAGGRTDSTTDGISNIDRIDYSNDSTAATPKGSLTQRAYLLRASGNTSFGYFSGGDAPGSGNFSLIQRIDYSNDTAQTAVKGSLTITRESHGASGNANFGYHGAGRTQTPSMVMLSSIERIDYSNDTATPSPKGPLDRTSANHGSTGSSSFGYYAGNEFPSAASSVSRIDYSNDTATASPKGPLNTARYMITGTSSQENGFQPISAIAAPVQPPFPFPNPLPVPPSPYLFDAENASSISGTIGGYSRTGTYCDPPNDLATGITYGSQDSTPFNTSTDRNSEIVRCYSFTNYAGRTFAAAICALCEKPPQGGSWPISNSWESAWWLQSGNDDSDILIVVFDSVKTFSGVEISSPSSQYSSSNDHVYAVRLSGSASSFTTDAIGDVAYNGSTTATISASFEAQAIAIYRNGATGWARIGNIRFLK